MLNLLLSALCHSATVDVIGYPGHVSTFENQPKYACGWVRETPAVAEQALESTKKVQACRAAKKAEKGIEHDGVFRAKETLPDQFSWEPLIREFIGGLDPQVSQKGKLPRDQKDIGSCTANTGYAVIVLTQAITFLREIAEGAKPADLVKRQDLADLFRTVHSQIFYPDITAGYALGRGDKELNTPFEDSGAMVYTVLRSMLCLGCKEKEYYGRGRFVDIGLKDYAQQNANGQFAHQTKPIALESWMVPLNLGDVVESDPNFDKLEGKYEAERLEAVHEQIQSALLQGPVAFGTPVTKYVMGPTGPNKDYIPYPTSQKDFQDERGQPLGGHAITIVGYDKNDKDELAATDGKSGLVYYILNSWGDDYAKGGIVRFSGRYIIEHGSEFSRLKSVKTAPTPNPQPTPPQPVPPTPVPPTPSQDYTAIIKEIRKNAAQLEADLSGWKDTESVWGDVSAALTELNSAIKQLETKKDKQAAIKDLDEAEAALTKLIGKLNKAPYTKGVVEKDLKMIEKTEELLRAVKTAQAFHAANEGDDQVESEAVSTQVTEEAHELGLGDAFGIYGHAVQQAFARSTAEGLALLHKFQEKIVALIHRHS